jgi:hypothetical protein
MQSIMVMVASFDGRRRDSFRLKRDKGVYGENRMIGMVKYR